MKVKKYNGCSLIEYDIYISRKVNLEKGNRYTYLWECVNVCSVLTKR